MYRLHSILRYMLALAIMTGAVHADFRTNINFGEALLRTTPAPPGYKSARDAAHAVRKGRVAHAAVPEGIPDNVLVEEDVPYASRENSSLRADVYRPRNTTDPSPILVFVHGGAWDHGNEDSFRAWGIHYAQRGYVAVAITYSLVQVAPYPTALNDVREAFRWAQSQAGNWKADPSRMAIVGQSAGAHLALMAAYQPDSAPRVQAVVNFYGPADLTDKPLRTSKAVRKFLGGRRYSRAEDRYREASPMTHTSPQCPPTLIFHGTVDSRVPVSQSDRLADTLQRNNVPYLYDRIEGWHHAMDLYAEVNAHCLSVMDLFLDTLLRGEKP
ncbi:MAG: alpha/beta hydrolase [Candidatus Hydrogenedentes bacterium]|nr:alpha/beta hydrolase [Candidatus Hydrogenedentota bacterium]